MLFHNRNKAKGFTLVEVLFVCSIFAIMVIGIILAINRSYVFMNNTRLQVRATNFAREGVEMMFNIRDTNRRRHSGKKDTFWIMRDNMSNVSSTYVPIEDDMLKQGLYTLEEKLAPGNDEDYYIYAQMITPGSSSNINEFYDDEGFWKDNYETYRNEAKITFTGTYSYLSGGFDLGGTWVGTQETGSMEELLGSETEFYRLVRVYGIYDKLGDSPEVTTATMNLTKSTPKELRFCVKVFYRTTSPHSSELCSIMTNFEK